MKRSVVVSKAECISSEGCDTSLSLETPLNSTIRKEYICPENRSTEWIIKPKDSNEGTCLFYCIYNSLSSMKLRAKFCNYEKSADKAKFFRKFCLDNFRDFKFHKYGYTADHMFMYLQYLEYLGNIKSFKWHRLEDNKKIDKTIKCNQHIFKHSRIYNGSDKKQLNVTYILFGYSTPSNAKPTETSKFFAKSCGKYFGFQLSSGNYDMSGKKEYRNFYLWKSFNKWQHNVKALPGTSKRDWPPHGTAVSVDACGRAHIFDTANDKVRDFSLNNLARVSCHLFKTFAFQIE